MWCHKPRLGRIQRDQLKAKVQWSGPMPVEMWRSGLEQKICMVMQTQWVISHFLSEGWEEPTAVSAPLFKNIVPSDSWRSGSILFCIFCISGVPPFLSVSSRCGNGGLEFGWSFINYCWPVRWCILCVGCVWKRTEVLATEFILVTRACPLLASNLSEV